MTGKFTRILTVAGALAALSAPMAGSSLAADLGGPKYTYKPAAVPAPLPPASWAGWYLGGHAGGVLDGDDDFIGGIHLGRNWQPGNVVYGIEGDISFADRIDYLASIRGRLGLALGPRWLVYGTAGVAFIDADQTFVLANGATFNDSSSEVGFAGGGGVELKLTDNVSAGVEGLYYAFDDDNRVGAFARDDLDFTVVRARLTYHFGGSRY
ncbi:MAG: outer membrane beta-barrel protein [Pseudomonadota bacterium]|nr:outer membrane beta-barrel protein [Pseudomonadota bacterium]